MTVSTPPTPTNKPLPPMTLKEKQVYWSKRENIQQSADLLSQHPLNSMLLMIAVNNVKEGE